jgi:hypothetical protein
VSGLDKNESDLPKWAFDVYEKWILKPLPVTDTESVKMATSAIRDMVILFGGILKSERELDALCNAHGITRADAERLVEP